MWQNEHTIQNGSRMLVKNNLKILVRLPNWLGDAVMASGVLSQIHAIFENPQVFVTGPAFICELFAHDPRVEGTFAYRPKGLQKYNPFDPVLTQMRHQKFDLAVVLTQSISSAWQIWCTRAKKRLGFSNEGRSFLLTDAPDFPPNRNHQHLVHTYQHLLEVYTSSTSRIFSPKLYLSASAQTEAANWFEKYMKGKQVVGLCPQAAYGPAKQWPSSRYRQLAQKLVANGYGVLVFADSQGKNLGKEITEGLDENLCKDLSGSTTMSLFMALMQRCNALVTNDSGPMHLAAALERPLVAIFGSTDDKVTGPYHDKSRVIHKRVECSPCFQRVCPIDFKCMNRIEVGEVFEEVQKAILS